MFEIVAAGVLGNLVGSWIAWGIGWYGRVELLEKHGKWFHITPKHLAWADRWFERYGGSHRVLLAHAAGDPHVHLAAGGRRADAVLEVHRR